jgi:signal transduction histidine kinase
LAIIAATTDSHETPLWRVAAEVAGAAVVYFALAKASLLFASINASATPIWPPTGLAIALILARGNFMLAGIFAGAFAANFTTTPSLLAAMAIAAGNTLEAYLACLLLKRWAEGERLFHSPTSIAKFGIIIIAAAAPLSASIGVSALSATGFAQWSNFGAIWSTWWLGDIGGAILIAPALVLWSETAAGSEPWKPSRAMWFTLLAAFLVGLVAFSPLSPAPSGSRSALAFIAILPLMWAALRLGLRDAATVALVISSFAVWGVAAGAGPFIQGTRNDSFVLLVAFIIAATLPSLALAAERRTAQTALDQTRHELVQAQKLEALGQFTGSVAHDFNNLLAAISGGLRVLERQHEERLATMQALSQTLDRGSTLTRQLLAFARSEPPRMETIDVTQAMDSVRTLIEQSVDHGIVLDVRVATGVWPVRVDRNQFELAVFNLAINARDAMPEGGEIVITAENVISDLGKSVAISVADNGPGMPPEVLERAFEPFFTTKGKDGTGLGLAQVYSFTKQSGGTVVIDNIEGRGAVVTITLPRA